MAPVGRRWTALRDFDAALAAPGTLCGVDEVGRGPLAGPVVAAAVILHPDATLEGLGDSKQLSQQQREALFPRICQQSLALGIAWIDPGTIDQINILRAALMAMERAIARLGQAPALVLVDGNHRLPRYCGPQQSVVKGDSKSAAIAAAAIIAKVLRDRYMTTLDLRHPAYGFAGHKGYYAPLQIDALRTLGPSPHHRASFQPRVLREPALPF